MNNKIRSIVVRCELPDTDDMEIAEYVFDALEAWGGQKRPEDPLFGGMRIITVRVNKNLFSNPRLR